MGESEKERLNRITGSIIGAAIAVHKALGPGLLESAYESCLVAELSKQEFHVERQKQLPVDYQGVRLKKAFRLDMVVEDAVVVEIKSVERLAGVHRAQMRSYLRFSSYKVGLVINFNVERLKDGVRRVVSGFPD
jgi:GxxExxY protein